MLVLCRCAQGPAPPGNQGRHYAPAWWEPGGSTDAPLFLKRCHSSCERKPDDSHQPGRVFSTFPFPPQHPEEREFFSKVPLRGHVLAHPFLLGSSPCSCWIHTWMKPKGVGPPSFLHSPRTSPALLLCFFLALRVWLPGQSSYNQVWRERSGFVLLHGRCLARHSPVPSVTLSPYFLPAKNPADLPA